MVAAMGDLAEAARLLGHLDTTGIFDVEGRAFGTLVEDAVTLVEADPDAVAIRVAAANDGIGEREVLVHMRDQLTKLLSAACG